MDKPATFRDSFAISRGHTNIKKLFTDDIQNLKTIMKCYELLHYCV